MRRMQFQSVKGAEPVVKVGLLLYLSHRIVYAETNGEVAVARKYGTECIHGMGSGQPLVPVRQLQGQGNLTGLAASVTVTPETPFSECRHRIKVRHS